MPEQSICKIWKKEKRAREREKFLLSFFFSPQPFGHICLLRAGYYLSQPTFSPFSSPSRCLDLPYSLLHLSSAFRQGYIIADCHVSVKDVAVPQPLALWLPLSITCFNVVSVQNEPNANQAGVKTVTYSRGDRSTTLLQALYEVSQVCGGSSPIPVDHTSALTMPVVVTLSTNTQDLNKVISRSQIENSKEGQSVFGVFGVISVDFLWVQKHCPPTWGRKYLWTAEKYPFMHFQYPLFLLRACGSVEFIPA